MTTADAKTFTTDELTSMNAEVSASVAKFEAIGEANGGLTDSQQAFYGEQLKARRIIREEIRSRAK